MKKVISITSDDICAEEIFSRASNAFNLATDLAGVIHVVLSAVKEAVPGLEFKVKDGPPNRAVIYTEITVTEEKK